MKQTLVFFPLAACFLCCFLFGCTQTKESVQGAADFSEESPEGSGTELSAAWSNKAKLVLLDQGGDLRGVELGCKPRAILEGEATEPQEIDKDFISYHITVDSLGSDSSYSQNDEGRLENLEFMDVRYLLEKGLLSAIEMDVYLTGQESLESLSEEVIDFLNEKTGVLPQEKNGRYFWRPDGEKVYALKKIEKKITAQVTDYGLSISIAYEEKKSKNK